MRGLIHVVRNGKMRYEYINLVGKSDWKRLLGTGRRRWNENITRRSGKN
jgi:hypothetical protein